MLVSSYLVFNINKSFFFIVYLHFVSMSWDTILLLCCLATYSTQDRLRWYKPWIISVTPDFLRIIFRDLSIVCLTWSLQILLLMVEAGNYLNAVALKSCTEVQWKYSTRFFGHKVLLLLCWFTLRASPSSFFLRRFLEKCIHKIIQQEWRQCE